MTEKHQNKLLSLSLRWGKDWYAPLPELVQTHMKNVSAAEAEELCCYIESVRSDVFDFISQNYDHKTDNITLPAEEVCGWIQSKYPWINKRNLSTLYSQGMYYAWHG